MMNEDTHTDPAPLTEKDLEAMAAASPQEPVTRFCYSLVLAEVIFQTDAGGVSSQRCQLFSKSDMDRFPAQRLAQIQNSAAHQVAEQVNAKGFKALESILLNILPLGWMTDEEFWGSQANIPHPGPAEPMPAVSNNGDNVVSLRPPASH